MSPEFWSGVVLFGSGAVSVSVPVLLVLHQSHAADRSGGTR